MVAEEWWNDDDFHGVDDELLAELKLCSDRAGTYLPQLRLPSDHLPSNHLPSNHLPSNRSPPPLKLCSDRAGTCSKLRQLRYL